MAEKLKFYNFQNASNGLFLHSGFSGRETRKYINFSKLEHFKNFQTTLKMVYFWNRRFSGSRNAEMKYLSKL